MVPILYVESSSFNNSNTNDQGGAIKAHYDISISKSTFGYCTSTNGGAIYTSNTTNLVTITDSTLFNNHGYKGGAIYGFENTVYYLVGSIFKSNSGVLSSGGLYSDSGYPKIIGGIFSDNTNLDTSYSQTFNENDFTNVNIVNVSPSLITESTQYLVPIVFDSEGIRAFGVYGQQCINGEATIAVDGTVLSCSCYNGWSGSDCNQN